MQGGSGEGAYNVLTLQDSTVGEWGTPRGPDSQVFSVVE